MEQLDATVTLAGVLAASMTAYAVLRRVRRPSGTLSPERVARLGSLEATPLGLLPPEPDLALPRPAVRARRLTPEGRARSTRPGAPRTAASAAEPGAAELLSLIGTMQWDRALDILQGMAAAGRDLGPVAAQAEAAVLERLRALPDSEVGLSFGGYRVLAALAPQNPVYGEKAVQGMAALDARREALMAGLTQDEDRSEPGTVWFNHPWNPRFDDVRLPIWVYIGCGADGRPRLRLRTNWLGDSRICVRGLEIVHDDMSETLTRGAYKIDADALGWEWRDEPADMYQIEVLRSLMGAGEVTLRYKGDPWPCETSLAEEERRAVGEMIELYDLMSLAPSPRCEVQAA